MNIIVTGGCGFIGSNLVDELVKQGHDVTVIDDLSSDAHDRFYFNTKPTYYHYSVTDYVMCSEVFNRHKPDYVLHFAAEVRIQNCIQDPTKAYETNLIGTMNMLKLSRDCGVKRFVLSTTSAIYGLKNDQLPQHEEMPPDCLNAYSLSKLAAEQACKMYSDLYGLSTACLRYFNVYGPRQPKKGPYAPVIGIFTRQQKNGEQLTIVGDGNQTRDYVFVKDVVNANILAATSEVDLRGDVFNVGSGENCSVNYLAKMISKRYTYLPARVGEARHTLADISKIKNVLGWQPTKSIFKYMEKQEYDN
jgi:nucleoside-diphosphate-sugar epimerase